jgi:hypothetical protein
MAGRGKQRATFEKRQRELARQERQAEKRARRQGRVEEPGEDPEQHHVVLGEWPTLADTAPGESDAVDADADANVNADADVTESPASPATP